MREKVITQFEKMQLNLKELLKNNDSRFSFTLDAWTALNGFSYYAITIHYINKDWELISNTRHLIPSKGKHTGKDIAEIFLKTVEDFDIINKIQGITMDNMLQPTLRLSKNLRL